jgi:hypothetical protein
MFLRGSAKVVSNTVRIVRFRANLFTSLSNTHVFASLGSGSSIGAIGPRRFGIKHYFSCISKGLTFVLFAVSIY